MTINIERNTPHVQIRFQEQLPVSQEDLQALTHLLSEDSQPTTLLPIVRLRHPTRKHQVINLVTQANVAEKISEYFRQGSNTPFKTKRSLIARLMLGDDSILTCDAHENQHLRKILASYIRSLRQDRFVNLCHQQFDKMTQTWMGHVNLEKEIPLLISRIGVKEVMGFTGDIEKICQDVQIMVQGPLKKGSLWQKVKNFVLRVKTTWFFPSEIRNHLQAQAHLSEKDQNAYYKAMKKHLIAQHGLDENAPLPKKAIETLIHNYTVILFGFQETTSSLLKHLLWQLAKKPELQEKYRTIAYEAQKYLIHDPQKYLEALKPFDALVEEALRMFSPTGFDRTLNENLTLRIDDKEYTMLKGEKIEYIPYLAGRSSENFKNPEEFDDARFSSKERSEASEGRKFALHFGSGKHHCVGESYARLKVKLLVAMIVDKFHLSTQVEQLNFYLHTVLKSYEDVWIDVEPYPS